MANFRKHPGCNARFGSLMVLGLLVHAVPAQAQAPPEVSGVVWCAGSQACLQWTPEAGATDYKVYQGDALSLAALLDASIDSCLVGTYSVADTGATLTGTPRPGEMFWYLVTARNGAGEGTAGDSTEGPRVVDTSGACPFACSRAADCPTGLSCNLAIRQCEAFCGDPSHTACNGGCCSAGVCVAGTANAVCGASGGTCTACSGGSPTCSLGTCTSACGAAGNGTCGSGNCCSGGTCVSGITSTTCGYSGVCVNCAGQSAGGACVTPGGGPYFCGCQVATDCAAANPGAGTPGQACNTMSHTCTNACNIPGLTACNGGCCNVANGLCNAGSSNTACGTAGAICASCASCNPGPTCVSGVCGCLTTAACQSASACASGFNPDHLFCSSNACVCTPTGQACSNSGQCCNGTCAGNLCN